MSIGASCLPEKLNPVVKPLMDSIRKEENIFFQKSAATHLCLLMDLALKREPCPNSKIIQNLVTYLCADGGDQDLGGKAGTESGILSLGSLTGPETPKKLTKSEEVAEWEANKGGIIQKRGAAFALTEIVGYFGVGLVDKVGRLWEITFGVLEACLDSETTPEGGIIQALLVLEVISPSFHKDLYPMVSESGLNLN